MALWGKEKQRRKRKAEREGGKRGWEVTGSI